MVLLSINYVVGYDGVNFYSGTKPAVGNQNFYFGVDGTIETHKGDIVLNPGDGKLLGDLKALGDNASIIITSKDTLDIYGSLTAQQNITISAGSVLNAGTTSVTTHGTSSINTLDKDGQILISGYNDVVLIVL
jgi:hypothetical protein